MNKSIFWARLLGLFTVILCIGIFTHIKFFQGMIITITKSPSETLIMGMFTLFLGLSIIVSHPIWRGWPIIVTLLGYWITIKGILFMFFPTLVTMAMNFWDQHLYLGPVPACVIGLILLYCGFCIRPKTTP